MLVPERGLLISLPAEELHRLDPTASVFTPDAIDMSVLSNELRWALQAATTQCAAEFKPVRLVARPEIFTHGESLRWLQDRIQGIRDHLCLSDGTAVRPISGMRNHLFLFRRASHRHAMAFDRLIGWMPELLGCMQTQVNSCLSVRSGGRIISPPTILLQSNVPIVEAGQFQFLRLRHHANPKASVRRTRDATLTVLSPRLRRLTYVPLTESACRNNGFMRKVAALIRMSQRREGEGVVMRLPLSGPDRRTEACLSLAIDALRAVGIKRPIKPGRVTFIADSPPSAALAESGRTVDLFADPSYEFWLHPKEYFAVFRSFEFWVEGSVRLRRCWQELADEAAGRTL